MAAKKEKAAGFRITGGLFFPLVGVDKFKQGDVTLIEAVTNMPWKKWLRLLGKEGLSHPLTKQGFLAVAIQRVRDTSAEDVVEFINDLPLFVKNAEGVLEEVGIELVVPDDPKAKNEAGPTEDGATEN